MKVKKVTIPRKYLNTPYVYLLLILLNSSVIASEVQYPLEPLDLSSPKATLNSFLNKADTGFRLLHDEYWNSPSHEVAVQLLKIKSELARTLDLSEIPPAAHDQISNDGYIYLYEILSRIELPPEADIPNAEFYAKTNSLGKNKTQKVNTLPISWTIPHTEITLVRIEKGAQTGQFLFSSNTVERLEEFYEKTRSLPYRRNVLIENYAEIRPYLSVGGWMISLHTINSFPDWLKYSIYKQAIWKWIALGMLIAISSIIVTFIFRITIRDSSGHSPIVYLQRTIPPVALLILTPLVLSIAIRQINLTGWIAGGIALVAELLTYISLAWVAWNGSIGAAEVIIASPKIPDQSLNAHLLRLIARVIGIIAVIALIFYLSKQLGLPLYGLIAGIGVGGIAVALAAQSTLENFIGSLNLFIDRPVRVGDFCRYGEDPNMNWQRVGTVESIGLRSTRIRGIDNSLTTIPNAEFSKMHIINYTMRDEMLLLSIVSLRYETTDDQLRFVIATLRNMLLAHPGVSENDPRVRFASFGDCSLDIELRVFINTSDRNEFRAIREDIYLRIIKIIKESGSGFAFPSRTIYHSKDNGLDMEQQKEAETQVKAWRAKKELPFPRFSAEHRQKVKDTLDYPPAGSPESNHD